MDALDGSADGKCTPAAALSPGLMVMGVPLISSVPPAEERLASEAEPVRTAGESAFRMPPLPRLLAAAGAPLIGLAEKFAGLSRSEPATAEL